MQVSDVSPDGQWLALYTLGERHEDIFVSRVDGSELRRVTDDAARDLWPRGPPTAGRWCLWRIVGQPGRDPQRSKLAARRAPTRVSAVRREHRRDRHRRHRHG